MSKVKALIPHLFTAGNLIGGVLAIIFALTGKLAWAPYCIFISAFLDFFDGFLARLLKVPSELGKQLDSLADMVTFGVAPGVIVFVMLKISILNIFCPDLNLINPNGLSSLPNQYLEIACAPTDQLSDVLTTGQASHYSMRLDINDWYSWTNWDLVQNVYDLLPLLALIIPVMSMFRLAKFNLDTRQTDSFIGVPTPASTLFFASLPLILIQNFGTESKLQIWTCELILNPWFLIVATIIMSILLVVELPLFALKFKSFGFKGNEIRYIFLTLSAVLLATLWWLAIPLIIILYILLSLIQNLRKR